MCKDGNILISIDLFLQLYENILSIYISNNQKNNKISVKEKSLSFSEIYLLAPICESEILDVYIIYII